MRLPGVRDFTQKKRRFGKEQEELAGGCCEVFWRPGAGHTLGSGKITAVRDWRGIEELERSGAPCCNVWAGKAKNPRCVNDAQGKVKG